MRKINVTTEIIDCVGKDKASAVKLLSSSDKPEFSFLVLIPVKKH